MMIDCFLMYENYLLVSDSPLTFELFVYIYIINCDMDLMYENYLSVSDSPLTFELFVYLLMSLS